MELQLGHLEAADADAAEALAIREKVFGLEHPDTAEARVLHGKVLLARGRLAQAETALRRGFEVLQKHPGREARQNTAREALVELYLKWKKPAEAARYRSS